MSAAVQRRHRALERERRDNILRHAGKKSSKQLREASHGLEGQEEQAQRHLDALLQARARGGAVVVALEDVGDLDKAKRVADGKSKARAKDLTASFRRATTVARVVGVRPGGSTSVVERYMSELDEEASAQLRELFRRSKQEAAQERSDFEAARPSVLRRGSVQFQQQGQQGQQGQQQQQQQPGRRRRRNSAEGLEYLPAYLQLGMEEEEEDDDDDESGDQGGGAQGDDEGAGAMGGAFSLERLLPGWFVSRWEAAVQVLRTAESRAHRAHRERMPSLDELRADPEASRALAALDRLRRMRAVLLGGSEELRARATDDDFDAEGTHIADGGGRRRPGGHGVDVEADDAAGSFAHHYDHEHGLFGGYSRELLRIRQGLARALKHGDEGGGVAKARFLLSALSQRARTDAAVLAPPRILPGVAGLTEDDPEHARYLWLCERAGRMEALAAAIGAAEAEASIVGGVGLEADATYLLLSNVQRQEMRRARFDVPLGYLVGEERRERLCEGAQWLQLLDDWRVDRGGGLPRDAVPRGGTTSPPASHASSPAAARRGGPGPVRPTGAGGGGEGGSGEGAGGDGEGDDSEDEDEEDGEGGSRMRFTDATFVQRQDRPLASFRRASLIGSGGGSGADGGGSGGGVSGGGGGGGGGGLAGASFRRGVGSDRDGGLGGGVGGRLMARLPFLRGDAELPWVDEVARQYGLEYAARQRAVGVAREMAVAGYTTAQARTVVLGMLHGTQAKLRDAWRVFVPTCDADPSAVLSRPEWRMVLGLISGGLGMTAQETDQLFTVFDQDGSGSLDYGEFCEVLDALPLQRALQESPLGFAVAALQSMLVLQSQLLSALSIEQLAAAGRVIARLKGAGLSDEDARTVVQAVFLSRSRGALRDAWEVLKRAASDADQQAIEGVGGRGVGGLIGGGKRGGQGGGGKSGGKGGGGEGSPGTSMRKGRRTRILHGNWAMGGGGAGGGGEDGIDAEGFARLIPLLGEDLPLSRVERLFEEVDLDASGTLDFDEFVLLVRRLKPKSAARAGRAAGLNAFDTLTRSSSGRPRALRASVPVARRDEAGLVLLTLRDFGYDNDQLISILQALYPSPPPPPVSDEHRGVFGQKLRGGGGVGGGGDGAGGAEVSRVVEHEIKVLQGGWNALGGGELVRLPVNPFDFRRRAVSGAATPGLAEKHALFLASDRWQCAVGIDAGVFSDLLALLAESTMAHAGGRWPEEVTKHFSAFDELGGAVDSTLPFPQFCRVVVEMRHALAQAAAHRAAGTAAEDAAGGGATGGGAAGGGVLALKPPPVSDESFANPMQRLARGGPRSASRDLRDRCPIPAWLGDVDAVQALGAASTRLGGQLKQQLIDTVVEPLSELGEGLDPLLPLSKATRRLIPPWQEPVIGTMVHALRRGGFPSSEVNILIQGLYLCNATDKDKATEAAMRAWRVLRAHASHFGPEEQDGQEESFIRGAGNRPRRNPAQEAGASRAKSRRRGWGGGSGGGGDGSKDEDEDDAAEDDPDGGRALPIEETFRFDHHSLESEACKRMMKLISTPLMKETQLNAIFLTFDANKDGAISFDELERLMRMLDPHKRLAKLKPIEVPHEPTPLEVGLSAAYEAARPGLEQLEQLWYTVNPLAARRDDDDDDDDDDDGDDGDEAR